MTGETSSTLAPWTAIPNAFLDLLMAACTGSEVKVVLYIARRTFGTVKGRENGSDAIALSQICNGIVKRDGTRLDYGTGLAREAAVEAIRRLEFAKVIERTKGNGRTADTWKIAADLPAVKAKAPEKPKRKQFENRTATSSEIEPLTGSKIEPLPVRKSNPQKKGSKSSSKKDLKPSFSVEGNTQPEGPKPQRPTPFSQKVDDDDKPKPENAGNRLKSWADRRGDPLSLTDWWSIKNSAEVRGLPLDELADLAEKNAGNWKSSAAGLRWLIKQFNLKTSDAPEEIPTPEPAEKCALCKCPKGEGVLLQGGHMEPCECATPEFRERVAQVIARDAAKASRSPVAGEAA